MIKDEHHQDSSLEADQRLRFEVLSDWAGIRLDRFLTEVTPNLSRARIKSLIDQGWVRLDGQRTKAGQKLKTGQMVDLTIPRAMPASVEPDGDVEFDILYQDEDIVVVNKPPGLVVHPAAGHWQGTLVHGLLAAIDDLGGVGGETRPGIVHRLDKDTSGVMVVAKTDRAHQALVEKFKGRHIHKEYLAVCLGAPKDHTGRIDSPIGRHPVKRQQMSTKSTCGRPAVTLYKVERRYHRGASLLKVKILTGRTHQIRVHLASIGYPILGDPVYGKGPEALRGGAAFKSLVSRQMLHARLLKLDHPITGQPMAFEAPLPDDMRELLDFFENDD